MALPTDSLHLTRLSPTEMVAIFTGMVETRFGLVSIANQFYPIPNKSGTNSIFNRYFGKTQLQAVIAGVRPPANPTPMSRRGVVVDTLVNARNNVDILNDVQSDFSILSEIAEDQGKTHALFYDRVFFNQLVKGAQAPAVPGVDSIPGGDTATLGAGQHLDPDALYDGIVEILQKKRNMEIGREELTVFVHPTQFDVLLKHDKLISKDFSSGSQDFAARTMHFISGSRIVETTSVVQPATAAGEHHLMSNANNGYAYDVTDQDAKAVAIIGHRRSLLGLENISLSADIWYNKEEKQWFVDSDIAFAVTWNRGDVTGAVFRA